MLLAFMKNCDICYNKLGYMQFKYLTSSKEVLGGIISGHSHGFWCSSNERSEGRNIMKSTF